MNSRSHPTSLLLLILALTVPAIAARAQQPDSLQALKRLTLDQLMNIEVTSVSRRAERLAQTASAIQVITQEDILRSGLSSLPEALRLAANLQVSQVDSRQWAISAGGFNSTTANKLLVLIDGGTVYTPLYSGVFWDVQDVPLVDVDRIEVISGPGATLWGANAVNGVINVITRNSRATQGLLVSGGGGTELRGFGNARYGGALTPTGPFGPFRARWAKTSTPTTSMYSPGLRGGGGATWPGASATASSTMASSTARPSPSCRRMLHDSGSPRSSRTRSRSCPTGCTWHLAPSSSTTTTPASRSNPAHVGTGDSARPGPCGRPSRARSERRRASTGSFLFAFRRPRSWPAARASIQKKSWPTSWDTATSRGPSPFRWRRSTAATTGSAAWSSSTRPQPTLSSSPTGRTASPTERSWPPIIASRGGGISGPATRSCASTSGPSPAARTCRAGARNRT